MIDYLVPGLLGIILLLLVGMVVLLLNRGKQSRAVEERLNAMHQNMAELKIYASSQQSDSRTLTDRLNTVQDNLTDLRAHIRARQDIERRTSDSIQRLEAVIAGTQSKGAAGENILEVVFAQLPAEWQERNFRVGNRVVEFGLHLPNNLILPIDSKWAATALLEQFVASDDVDEQLKIKRRIEHAVMMKAKEVRKYLDPNLTTPFGVAVVPDAVYDLCAGVQADVFRLNVVLISYSLFVPYLLLVFQTMLKSSQSIDIQRLEAYLHSVEENLDALQGELEGRFSRAITMLTNSGNDMRTHVSQIKGGLASIQISTPTNQPAQETPLLIPEDR